jgi:hypothetical protein
MKGNVSWAAITLLIFIGSIKGQSIKQLQGTWINKEYAVELQAEKDPRGTTRKNVFYIVISDNGVMMQYDLHVSFDYKKIEYLNKTKKDNTYLMILANDTTKHYLTLINRKGIQQLTWKGHFDNYPGRDSWGTKRFYKIERSFQHECDRLILGGKYSDSIGQEYTFTDSGYAFWPNKTIKYEVCLDYLSITKNCIIDYSDKKPGGFLTVYGFKANDDILLLYREKESTDTIAAEPAAVFEKRPFITLRKKHD